MSKEKKARKKKGTPSQHAHDFTKVTGTWRSYVRKRCACTKEAWHTKQGVAFDPHITHDISYEWKGARSG